MWRWGRKLEGDEVHDTCKKIVIRAAAEMVGYKVEKGGRKGKAWWTDKEKDAIEKKRKADKRRLQRNVPEEVNEKRLMANKDCKKHVKEVVYRVDEEFGRKPREGRVIGSQ